MLSFRFVVIFFNMAYAFFYGLFTGLLLSSMLGTVFFCLVQNSIINGFKSGAYVSTGVIISDIILILLSYFSATLFPQGGHTEMIIRICGAVFLLAMGISNLRSHKKILFPNADNKSPLMLASKGFMLNILNPGNYLSWLAVSATAFCQYGTVAVLFRSIGRYFWNGNADIFCRYLV
jgi:L-lysine exporter family protein LysE/ArgO